MTLYQALQRAGGLLETAHRKQIILIRKDPDGRPVGHVIDIRPIQSGKNPSADLPVRPLDIVFVPRSKIAQVDLFVKQYIRDCPVCGRILRRFRAGAGVWRKQRQGNLQGRSAPLDRQRTPAD